MVERFRAVQRRCPIAVALQVNCLVGEEGFEPSSLAAADFKSAVYAIPPLAHRGQGFRERPCFATVYHAPDAAQSARPFVVATL